MNKQDCLSGSTDECILTSFSEWHIEYTPPQAAQVHDVQFFIMYANIAWGHRCDPRGGRTMSDALCGKYHREAHLIAAGYYRPEQLSNFPSSTAAHLTIISTDYVP